MNNPGSGTIPNEILIAELKYVTGTAQQANEDRMRVTQYYFMALGSIAASLVGLREIPASIGNWPIEA
jgi:hypothetical protein